MVMLPGFPESGCWMIGHLPIRGGCCAAEVPDGVPPEGPGPSGRRPPSPVRRVGPGSSRGAPARRQARRAAPRRNPSSERRSAPACTAGLTPIGAADATPGSGPERQDGKLGWTTCKCGNSHRRKWPSSGPVGEQAARVTRSTRRGDLPRSQAGQRLEANVGPAAPGREYRSEHTRGAALQRTSAPERRSSSAG